NNTIGIVGVITAPVKLIVDANDWKQRVYETTLTRIRPSGTADTFILRFAASAAGTERMLAQIAENAEVLVGGEIRTENVSNPQPGENRVKIYIYAEVIAVNEPPADDQNEVKLRGFVCRAPWYKTTKRRQPNGRKMHVTDTIIAVNTPNGTSYIPCACFGENAIYAKTLKVGDRVDVYGRMQSRKYEKKIEGHEAPYLFNAYEVCAVKIQCTRRKEREREEAEA
ncbi:MAG: single-stranded DNA-binding protein, partial [Lachnospiraceae bacterium]|nr:single-stranded DNA-binding protein [Lachnospiraceae bacterium]